MTERKHDHFMGDVIKYTQPCTAINKVAIPDKPDAKLTLRVAELIRDGVSMRNIAKRLSIPTKKLQAWLDKDPSESTHEERHFQRAVGAALQETTAKAMKCVMDSIENGNSADARWLLERLNPEVYGGKQRVEVSGPEGAPVKVASLSRIELIEQIRHAMEEGQRLTDGEE